MIFNMRTQNESYHSTIARILLSVMGGALIVLVTSKPVVAGESTPTASPKTLSQATGSANLDDLKARLATKVAELRTTVKRALYGTVKSVSVTSATIETKTKDIKLELTDDVMVTQILSGKRTTLPIEDVATKDMVTVFGTYDETLDLLKAQYIFIESSAVISRIAGTVIDLDTEEFVLTVNTKEGRTILVDIEKATKTNMWTKEGGIVKGGFSKIAIGDTVHVVGKPVAKKDNQISASRILDLGNLSGAVTPTISPTVPASSSATVKETPISTPKPSPIP